MPDRSNEFEMIIRIWTDNNGKATADLETRIGGEATGKKEPTVEAVGLSDIFANLGSFFESMVEPEHRIEDILERSKNAN